MPLLTMVVLEGLLQRVHQYSDVANDTVRTGARGKSCSWNLLAMRDSDDSNNRLWYGKPSLGTKGF
jgi:hypothetical protein